MHAGLSNPRLHYTCATQCLDVLQSLSITRLRSVHLGEMARFSQEYVEENPMPARAPLDRPAMQRVPLSEMARFSSEDVGGHALLALAPLGRLELLTVHLGEAAR